MKAQTEPLLYHGKQDIVNSGCDGYRSDTESAPTIDSEKVSVRLDEGEDLGPVLYVRVLAAIASLNSCNIGYDIGINTGVAGSFQRGDGLTLSNVQLEMYMGLLSFAALVGALSMFAFSDNFGRRVTFIVSQVVLIVGIAIMIVSSNYGLIMFGRLLHIVLRFFHYQYRCVCI